MLWRVSWALAQISCLSSLSWRKKWRVSWFNDFIRRWKLSHAHRSWPTLSIVWPLLYTTKPHAHGAACQLLVSRSNRWLNRSGVGLRATLECTWLQVAHCCCCCCGCCTGCLCSIQSITHSAVVSSTSVARYGKCLPIIYGHNWYRKPHRW